MNDEKNYLKINGIERFRIQKPPIMDFSDGCLLTSERISAAIVNAYESAVIEEIFQAAKRDGITDLYLVDREFITEAIRNELARREHNRQVAEFIRNHGGNPDE